MTHPNQVTWLFYTFYFQVSSEEVHVLARQLKTPYIECSAKVCHFGYFSTISGHFWWFLVMPAVLNLIIILFFPGNQWRSSCFSWTIESSLHRMQCQNANECGSSFSRIGTYSSHVFTNPEFSICNFLFSKKSCLFDTN